MEDKTKYIIIVLLAVLAGSLFFNLQFYSSKRTAERERDGLKNENEALTKKIEDSLRNNKQLEDKINSLAKDLDKISQDKNELEKKFELMDKERVNLAEQLTKQKKEAQKAVVSEDAYWAGILKEKTNLELKIENMLTELKNLKIGTEQLEREKNVLELDLKNLNSEKTGLEQELSYHRKMLDNMVTELVQEKNAKRQYQETLQPLKKENTSLRQQLKVLSKQRARLEEKVVQLQEGKTSIERKFNEMGLLLEYRLSQVNELKAQMDNIRSGAKFEGPLPEIQKESVELPPIVIHPQSGAPVFGPSAKAESGPFLGKVLALNAENNFVIVDAGSDAGVKAGDNFEVYRQGSLIAKIAVIQVRKGISACDIKREIMPIKVGDVIR